MKQDAEHLKLLSIFCYVAGGLFALFSLIPSIHLALGIGFVSGAIPRRPSETAELEFLGWMFIIGASTIIALGLTFSSLIALTGWLIHRRRGYVFCLVMAGVACTAFPTGTLLGVFTFLVLLRPSVRALFAGQRPLELPVLTPANGPVPLSGLLPSAPPTAFTEPGGTP